MKLTFSFDKNDLIGLVTKELVGMGLDPTNFELEINNKHTIYSEFTEITATQKDKEEDA